MSHVGFTIGTAANLAFIHFVFEPLPPAFYLGVAHVFLTFAVCWCVMGLWAGGAK